jgi:hypothetical protein
MLAQAWIRMPWTLKCSLDNSRHTLGRSSSVGQELGRDVALQQPVAVLGEARVIPDRVVDEETCEPAEQEVEVEPFHQLALRRNRIAPAVTARAAQRDA